MVDTDQLHGPQGWYPAQKSAGSEWKENFIIAESRIMSLVYCGWLSWGAGGVDSAVRARYFQRGISAVGPNYFAGEEGVMVKYIAVGSYWLGVVCALVSVVGRLCDAFGIAFVRILTKGNVIDVRSFLDAGLLFLFIAIASANYEWFQSRQRGS